VRRDVQVKRQPPVAAAQLAGKFKAYQSAHAVAEKSEWFIQVRPDGLGQNLNERGEARKGRFPQPTAPSGKLNGADLDALRQGLRPGVEERRTAASIREAEQSPASLWIRLKEVNPGVYLQRRFRQTRVSRRRLPAYRAHQ